MNGARHRVDDGLVASMAGQGIAYVPYFPLGGFSPLQSETLASVVKRLDVAVELSGGIREEGTLKRLVAGKLPSVRPAAWLAGRTIKRFPSA